MATSRASILLAAVGGLVGFIVAVAGSLVLGIAAGLVTFAIGLWVLARVRRLGTGAAEDPGRRRFLLGAGAAGLALTAAGPPLGWLTRKLARRDARPVQEAMARGLGAEYMELVRRQYFPGRAGDLQMVLAPFNSSNYPNESLSLVKDDPRTSHASLWMYLERIPLVVHFPSRVDPADNVDRVTLADLAPTTAALMGFQRWPEDRAGSVLPLPIDTWNGYAPKRPKVVVTFVIDGGGWNVLQRWPDDWPHLKRLMGQGANFRNAIHGSFPAVTACAHATIGTGTFPNQHGITGHNIRDELGNVRKAFRDPGLADPSDILVPTLADLWYDETQGRAWLGQIGYQVWHLGMLGHGGRVRADASKPVGVYWDEVGASDWVSHNPDLFRLPSAMPDRAVFDADFGAFWASPPPWDEQFTPQGRQTPCCSPPVVKYQGDLIEATFDSEPIGEGPDTSLLYINYKSPDYTGHIYGMGSLWTGLQLRAVDEQLGRLRAMLDERFPGAYALIVTADHGQCPLPDEVGGVRLDPIQLQGRIESSFNGAFGAVQSVVPHEVYLDTGSLWDNGGATVEDVAASLRDYRYRENIGPYVPRSAVEQQMLDQPEFSAVFASSYLETLDEVAVAGLGSTSFGDGDTDIPEIP